VHFEGVFMTFFLRNSFFCSNFAAENQNFIVMKKISLLFALVLLLATPVKAQQLSAMIKNAIPNFARGIVHYRDGRQVEYMWVEMPKIGSDKVKVSNDAKHKKTETLDAQDIEKLTVWSDKFPDDQLTLWHIHADKSKLPMFKATPVDAWGYPIVASAWGVLFECNASYEIDKKSGKLMRNIVITYMQGVPFVEPVPCYLICKDFENAQFIGRYNEQKEQFEFAGVGKNIAPFFASNPAISKKIASKKLTGKDIQYILDEMAAYHGLKVEEIVEEKPIETNSNGVAGDDE